MVFSPHMSDIGHPLTPLIGSMTESAMLTQSPLSNGSFFQYACGQKLRRNSDYYREQAVEYRKLADAAEDPAAKKEFLELAEACEEAADKIDDCRASG